MTTIADRAHAAAVQSRPSTRRGAYSTTYYRWACPCGDTGRWTAQYDTALQGALRHDERNGAL